jgi:hypothetical protein
MAKIDQESSTTSPLSINGLRMPTDFPTPDFEAVQSKLTTMERAQTEHYRHFAGSWNALSMRYMALVQYADTFSASVAAHGIGPCPKERYEQERLLFGFFSNGFSTFEAYFYGMFSIGAMLAPEHFPFASAADHQRVTASRTLDAYARAFASDPIISAFKALLSNPAYKEWREVRNVLTHRTAPGRTFFIGFDESDTPPTQWKLLNISLDHATMPSRRAQASVLITAAVKAAGAFVTARFS